MEAVRNVTARAVPLRRSDIDTDQIIPSDWLKRVERTGFGEGLFSQWREDPAFVLNDPRHAEAEILIAGPNFGTGSSREHAVWALMDYGFRAVISPRFGDIFRNNSTKNGLLAIVLPDETVNALLDAIEHNHEHELVIDVTQLRVRCDALDIDEPFPLDEFTQYRFLNGLDDIGITMENADAIDTYETKRSAFKPITTP